MTQILFRLNDNAALLSNAEVYSHLECIKSELKSPKFVGQNKNEMEKQLNEKEQSLQRLNTIVYETLKYLEELPCSIQNAENIQAFLTEISAFSLTKGEKLQILNLRPTSLVEIQLLIEESEERFTEDQMNLILDVVARTLPAGPGIDNITPSDPDYEDNGMICEP